MPRYAAAVTRAVDLPPWRLAAYSGDDHYRYLREIELLDGAGRAAGDATVVIVGKNPSTADDSQDDSTTRAIHGWARRSVVGVGRIRLVNLFARRGSKPRALDEGSLAEVIDTDTDRLLLEAVQDAKYVIAAWGGRGNPPLRNVERYHERIGDVVDLLGEAPWTHVGPLVGRGYPLHPYNWNGLYPDADVCMTCCDIRFPARCRGAG